MFILTGKVGYSPPAARQKPCAALPVERGGLVSSVIKSAANWRDITLNEAVVEIPQTLLDMSAPLGANPIAHDVAQAGVSALAFTRAYQGLKGTTVEQKMEGASSLALGVAGTLSLLPGGLAAGAAKGFMFGQGAIELSLGIRELNEEFRKKDKPAWKEVTTGVLDTVKGAATFVPLFFPQTTDVVNAIQLTALVSKTLLETTIVHRGPGARPVPCLTPPAGIEIQQGSASSPSVRSD